MPPIHFAARAYASWDTHDLYVSDEMHNREGRSGGRHLHEKPKNGKHVMALIFSQIQEYPKKEFSAATLHSLHFSKQWCDLISLPVY